METSSQVTHSGNERPWAKPLPPGFVSSHSHVLSSTLSPLPPSSSQQQPLLRGLASHLGAGDIWTMLLLLAGGWPGSGGRGYGNWEEGMRPLDTGNFGGLKLRMDLSRKKQGATISYLGRIL